MQKPHYRMMTDGNILPAIRATDGFRNVVANLGTDRDKASASGYTLTTLDRGALFAAYRSSDVAKAIVDVPAEDACREWREWQAEEDQISAIEAEEKRLGLRKTVLEALRRARLFGGAAIYIGTGEANPARALNPDTIRRGGLRYLSILGRHQITAGQIERDPRNPGYGRPASYQMAAGVGGQLDIHPSRLVILRGDEVPDDGQFMLEDGWGDSVLQSAMQKITHLDGTMANIASLVFEAKIDVVKIKDFTEGLRSGGGEYERMMLDRFRLAMMAKGINGTLLLDGEEEYEQKSATFTTLPDIIDRFMQAASAAARMPMTKLFRTSPGGMNATGESDIRQYYDDIKQMQTLDLEPAMGVLDECLIRSALGDRPEEIHFNWRSLWQMSERERAEVADKLTASAERLAKMEVPFEVVTETITNALTELGAFPGLESKMTEHFGKAGPVPPAGADPLTGDPVEGDDE